MSKSKEEKEGERPSKCTFKSIYIFGESDYWEDGELRKATNEPISQTITIHPIVMLPFPSQNTSITKYSNRGQLIITLLCYLCNHNWCCAR